MVIEGLDHVVLTVRDVRATCDFYARALGMRVVIHDDPTRTFQFAQMYFGSQKINLHQLGHEFEPKAIQPTPGSGDFCFITPMSPTEVVEHLRACGVAIVEGPVPRNGARGPMTSIYFRDPDQNLVEVAHYD